MLAALALSLLLHTGSEFAVWQDDWTARAEEAGWVLTVEMTAEWQEMFSRHPEYGEEVVPSATQSVAAVAAPPLAVYAPGVEQWRTLVEATFPADRVEWAMRVMACESGGNPLAQHPGSRASGLFQFLPSTWERIIRPNLGFTAEQVWDPASNIAAATWLLATEGAGQWVCK